MSFYIPDGYFWDELDSNRGSGQNDAGELPSRGDSLTGADLKYGCDTVSSGLVEDLPGDEYVL